MRNRIPAMRRN